MKTLKELSKETPAFGKKLAKIALAGSWGGKMVPLNNTESKILNAILKLGGLCRVGDIARYLDMKQQTIRNSLNNCKLFKQVGHSYKVDSRYAYNAKVGYFVEV